MNKLKGFFKKKESIKTYDDFWLWFAKHEKEFSSVVKQGEKIETLFFDKLSSKLDELRSGYFFLVGMHDKNTIELVITADGNIKNIVFVEELIEKAPSIAGWMFTAHKPEMDINNLGIRMNDFQFDKETLYFFPNENPDYPDEIDISITHTKMTMENKEDMTNGIYIFLDNYLGELSFINDIDNLKIAAGEEITEDLIPISKLKDYINWRQKEFIEKHEGVRYNTENDEYSLLEAELENEQKLLATVNSSLLKWDGKASHPWISVMTLKYKATNSSGMPGNGDSTLLNEIEDEIMLELKDHEGYLNIGRQTAKNEREIYFACKDFRKPAKVFHDIQQKHANRFEIEYDIYKDKYWASFERFGG